MPISHHCQSRVSTGCAWPFAGLSRQGEKQKLSMPDSERRPMRVARRLIDADLYMTGTSILHLQAVVAKHELQITLLQRRGSMVWCGHHGCSFCSYPLDHPSSNVWIVHNKALVEQARILRETRSHVLLEHRTDIWSRDGGRDRR